jgi:hypothetical protein
MASNRTTRAFLDFEVDGPLYGLMLESGFDNVSPVWLEVPVPEGSDRAIARLLGKNLAMHLETGFRSMSVPSAETWDAAR